MKVVTSCTNFEFKFKFVMPFLKLPIAKDPFVIVQLRKYLDEVIASCHIDVVFFVLKLL